MNIFYLHEDPQVSAKMHCDKHVVKMILESAQMLSTAHRVLDGDDIGYAKTIKQATYEWAVNRQKHFWLMDDDLSFLQIKHLFLVFQN